MELMTIITLIIEVLLGIILALIGFIVKDMKGKINQLETDVKGMKDNYLSRFERVINNQNDAKTALIEQHTQTKEELLNAFNDLRLEIVKNYQTKGRRIK